MGQSSFCTCRCPLLSHLFGFVQRQEVRPVLRLLLKLGFVSHFGVRSLGLCLGSGTSCQRDGLRDLLWLLRAILELVLCSFHRLGFRVFVALALVGHIWAQGLFAWGSLVASFPTGCFVLGRALHLEVTLLPCLSEGSCSFSKQSPLW